MEDSGRSGSADSFLAGGRATPTDHRDTQGDVGSVGSAFARFPQYRHQGIRVDAAVSGDHEGEWGVER